jgi:hypothetical protein
MVSDPVAAGVGIARDDPRKHPPYMVGLGTMQPVAEAFKMARRLNPRLAQVLFLQRLQALIELAGEGTEEWMVLENISDHLAARGVARTLPAEFPSMRPGTGVE